MKRFEEVTGITFEEFYNEQYSLVKAYLVSKFDYFEELEDAVSIAFTSLYKAVNDGLFDSSKASLKTYFYRIAYNECINQFRIKNKLKTDNIIDDGNYYMPIVDDREEYDEELDIELYKRINELSHSDRYVILQRLNRVKYKDIATKLDVNINKIKADIIRIQKKLK